MQRPSAAVTFTSFTIDALIGHRGSGSSRSSGCPVKSPPSCSSSPSPAFRSSVVLDGLLRPPSKDDEIHPPVDVGQDNHSDYVHVSPPSQVHPEHSIGGNLNIESTLASSLPGYRELGGRRDHGEQQQQQQQQQQHYFLPTPGPTHVRREAVPFQQDLGEEAARNDRKRTSLSPMHGMHSFRAYNPLAYSPLDDDRLSVAARERRLLVGHHHRHQEDLIIRRNSDDVTRRHHQNDVTLRFLPSRLVGLNERRLQQLWAEQRGGGGGMQPNEGPVPGYRNECGIPSPVRLHGGILPPGYPRQTDRTPELQAGVMRSSLSPISRMMTSRHFESGLHRSMYSSQFGSVRSIQGKCFIQNNYFINFLLYKSIFFIKFITQKFEFVLYI